LKYGMVATREIVEGAELTCDYCLFEFEAGSASIMDCQCGATECIKEIKGFRYLTFPQALARFASAEGYVVEAYLEEHPEIYFLDLRSPKSEKKVEEKEEGEVGIDVLWVEQEKEKEGGGEKVMVPKVVATKGFAAGEVVLGGIEFNNNKGGGGEKKKTERDTYTSFIVALRQGLARGSASVDLTGLETEKEMEEAWALRYLLQGEGGGNVKIEKKVEGRDAGEGEGGDEDVSDCVCVYVTYDIVAVGDLAVGEPLVLA
jgi:hypothetical protein